MAKFELAKFEYTIRDAIGRDWQCGTTIMTLDEAIAMTWAEATPPDVAREG